MATEITREGLKTLNRKIREKISIGIKELEDESGYPIGMQVSIVLPVEVV